MKHLTLNELRIQQWKEPHRKERKATNRWSRRCLLLNRPRKDRLSKDNRRKDRLRKEWPRCCRGQKEQGQQNARRK